MAVFSRVSSLSDVKEKCYRWNKGELIFKKRVIRIKSNPDKFLPASSRIGMGNCFFFSFLFFFSLFLTPPPPHLSVKRNEFEGKGITCCTIPGQCAGSQFLAPGSNCLTLYVLRIMVLYTEAMQFSSCVLT